MSKARRSKTTAVIPTKTAASAKPRPVVRSSLPNKATAAPRTIGSPLQIGPPSAGYPLRGEGICALG
jgi:hypothetical protein